MVVHQMHSNQGGDLLTYLVDPSVFDVHDGYVEALQGWLRFSQLLYQSAALADNHHRARAGSRN